MAFTGGDITCCPEFYAECADLVKTNTDLWVLLETNGSLDIRKVSNKCVKIVDVKCPGSGMSHANNLKNLDYLSVQDEVKFVMGSREDFEFAKMVIDRRRKNQSLKNPVHFAPVSGKLKPRELAKWILEEHLLVHLQVQLHKI